MPVWRKEGFGQSRRQSLILFPGFLDHSTGDQVLELLISPEPKHFLAATGGVPCAQILMQDLEELFKLERGASGKDRNQFFRNEIRHSA